MTPRLALLAALALASSALALAVAVPPPPMAPTVQIAPGVRMPRINLGTCCGSKVSNAFPAWWAAGGKGVDTAYDYGKEVPGGKETDLAKAIAKVGAAKANGLFITTKIRAGLDVLHGGKLCIGLDAAYALKAVKADLGELNVKQVDLVLLHAPCDRDATNAKLWQGMEQALKLNLTRAIGVSNYPKKQLVALLATATTKPAVQQCQMSMAQQEDEMLKLCAAQGIVFEAYAAMRACPFSNPKVQAIAKKHGVSVSQVCLRWVLQKGAVFAVGLGTNVSQMPEYSKEDLDLYGFALSAVEMTVLDGTGKEIGSCAQGY